jgi:hypothetical protein
MKAEIVMGNRAKKDTEENPEHFRGLILRGWIIVVGIALVFIIYGLFAFFVIGDKPPPDWDFGTVKDIPGESVYSTYPYRGGTEAPEPQHVNQKPPNAVADLSNRVPPAPGEGKPKQRKLQREAEPGQGSGQQGRPPSRVGTE